MQHTSRLRRNQPACDDIPKRPRTINRAGVLAVRRAGLRRLGAVVFIGGLIAGSSAGRDDPPATAGITADRTDQATARANRETIEAGLLHGGTVTLPAGTITLDRAVQLTPAHSGSTLRGAGMSRTVLVNRYTGGPYFANQTLSAVGSGISYADTIAGRDGAKVTLGQVTDLSLYTPGSAAYAFRFHGYLGPGQACARRRVVAAQGKVVTLDQAPDATCDCLTPLDGVYVADCLEGQKSVTCDPPSGVSRFKAGDHVAVGSGPSVADEFFGEFRVAAAVDAKTGTVTLNRPLRRGYKQATLVRVKPVAGVVLEDLTLANPVNKDAEPFAIKFAKGWRLTRVRCLGNLTLGAAWDCRLVDCEVAGQLFMGASGHDVVVRGGRSGTVAGEEGQHDVLLDDMRVGPWYQGAVGGRTSPNGVLAHFGCERWTLRGVRVEGPLPGGMPLSLGGRGCVLDGVTVVGKDSSYLWGDGLRVTGLRSDGPVYLQAGRRMSVSHCRAAPLVLGPGDPAKVPPSSGVAADVGRNEPNKPPTVTVPNGSHWTIRP